MNIAHGADGSPTCTDSSKPWDRHQNMAPENIDVLRLKETGRFGVHVCIVEQEGIEVVAKIVRLHFEIWRVENETRVYEMLTKYEMKSPEFPMIAPAFLRHLIEEGRVMGMLIEKLQGMRACIEDLEACENIAKHIYTGNNSLTCQ